MSRSMFLAAAFAFAHFAGTAWAGSFNIIPGTSAIVDVGDRESYTTLTIVNRGTSEGSLQLPGGRVIGVPAGGQMEVYDRLGHTGRGPSYVTITNNGSTPLRVVTRYQFREQLP